MSLLALFSLASYVVSGKKSVTQHAVYLTLLNSHREELTCRVTLLPEFGHPLKHV